MSPHVFVFMVYEVFFVPIDNGFMVNEVLYVPIEKLCLWFMSSCVPP